MDDELVLEIDITWSDERKNQVKRTLNEVSILERDMRHGNITPTCNLTPINIFLELLGMKKREKVEELEKYFNGFKGRIVPQ